MKSTEEAAEAAGAVLRRGGTVAFPTDTVYGLGAVFSDRDAVRSIFEAKGRPENKPLSILVSGIDQVHFLTDSIPEDALKLMKKFWPGALTLVFRKREDACIPEEVTAGGDTIGVRMPDNAAAVSIIAAAGRPLAAPSANISGRRSASKAEEVTEDLYGKIDLIIDGGDCTIGVASTVVDASTSRMKILREGSITRRMIEEVTGAEIL
ncbi:MAG: threonylcarbamoyl-AMP synthase [Parasporobacterium sp.]|nr:threonylcarbamoyl-AMP synthase [Parasporobacterium sp.]